MSFQWSQQAPAFEFPTCYRTENRFLTLRATALILLALAILWVALAEPDTSGPAIVLSKVRRGDSWPHIAVALVLLALGAIDLWVAARQQRLLLAPGQPAPLTADLVRPSKGLSSGAGWLMQVLTSGKVEAPEMQQSYGRALTAIAPHLPAAPNSLQSYLGVRVAHLLFALGLLTALGLSAAVSPTPALALSALLYGAIAAALVARSTWITKSAPSPLALASVLVTVSVVGVATALLGNHLPAIGRLAGLGLPMATAALLLCLFVIESLGLLAGRFKVDSLPDRPLGAASAQISIAAEPDRLLEEIERELHRYWAEGVPNRRHAWHVTLGADNTGAAPFSATVLEESQPILAPAKRQAIAAPPMGRKIWLLALGMLGLVLTLAGGLLWIRLAHAHVQDDSSSWATAGIAIVLVLAGGYAIRAGHFLWSRIEVESSLLWLECKGAATGSRAAEAATALRLTMSVIRARSVFYAAGDHRVGSRTLLRLKADAAAAQNSVQQLQAYAERQSRPMPPDRPTTATQPVRAPKPAKSPLSDARFCPKCGGAVLPGADFCQHCGASLRLARS